MRVEMIGGPKDGLVVDTDRICNNSNLYCPIHGHCFDHTATNNDAVILSCVELKYFRSGDNPDKAYFAGVAQSGQSK